MATIKGKNFIFPEILTVDFVVRTDIYDKKSDTIVSESKPNFKPCAVFVRMYTFTDIRKKQAKKLVSKKKDDNNIDSSSSSDDDDDDNKTNDYDIYNKKNEEIFNDGRNIKDRPLVDVFERIKRELLSKTKNQTSS